MGDALHACFISKLLRFLSILYFYSIRLLSWNGTLLFYQSSVSLSLVVLSFAVILFIRISESRSSVKVQRVFLRFLVIFLRGAVSFVFVYILLEVSVIFLIILLLSYGAQPQKIGAFQYLIFFSVFRRIPLLGVALVDFSVIAPSDRWVLWLMSLGFFIKLPLYFLHLWLPRVHVESPTSVSVVLAALLLKMGCWGLYMLASSYYWSASYTFVWLGLLGMLLCPLVCLVSGDCKVVIAYSSVVHMGFFFVVYLRGSPYGLTRSLLVLVGHGYVSGLLF